MYKPLLAPNEKINLEELNYPLLASIKMDGIRCIFKNGEILSRSLKQIQNKQLRERFEPLRKLTKTNNIILDGEIYSPNLTFQQITHFVMTQDLEGEILPESLKFYCFDCITDEDYNESFSQRHRNLVLWQDEVSITVKQSIVNNKEDVISMFEGALAGGQEGLILRDPNGRYKCGRGTIKEGIIYKVKPWETFDAVVRKVIQSTEVREDAEKKTNELGRSVTSKKKDDRVLIEKASAFEVLYNDLPLKVTLAMSDVEKEEVWKNQNSYIGRMIEYKGMTIGAKNLPRHPVFLRFIDERTK